MATMIQRPDFIPFDFSNINPTVSIAKVADRQSQCENRHSSAGFNIQTAKMQLVMPAPKM